MLGIANRTVQYLELKRPAKVMESNFCLHIAPHKQNSHPTSESTVQMLPEIRQLGAKVELCHAPFILDISVAGIHSHHFIPVCGRAKLL